MNDNIRWYMKIPLFFVKTVYSFETKGMILVYTEYKKLWGKTYIIETSEENLEYTELEDNEKEEK